MKRLAVQNAESCAACLQCENSCSLAFYKETGKPRILVKQKDDKVKVSVCVQCGKCAKVCEKEAITQNKNGVYMISQKACVNCGKCVEECPFGLIVPAEGEGAVPGKCIACGKCVQACPMDVLYIKESK